MRAMMNYIKVLSLLRQDYPDAFIAGGYLRDLDHNLPPKDLDVFTFNVMRSDEVLMESKTEDWYVSDRICFVGIRHIIDFPVPIQVIGLTCRASVDEAVSEFALGIQQIYYDGNQVVKRAPYIKDCKDKTFTVTRCDSYAEAAAIGYKVTQLKKKYPDYRLVIPPECAELAMYLECNRELADA